MPAKRNNLQFEIKTGKGEELMRELILYIAEECADDPTFGATKLNKILFFADFLSYSETGDPITGVAYQRLPQGPAPKNLMPIRNKMERAREIAVSKKPFGHYNQHRVVALRPAKLEHFSGQDIAMVDRVIKGLWGITAAQVSDMSHQRAWRVAGDQELIPYEAALISDEPITDYEINRTKELSERYGWET